MIQVGQTVVIKECHNVPEVVGKKATVITVVPQDVINAIKEQHPETKVYPIGVQFLEGEHEGQKGGFREDELEVLGGEPIPQMFTEAFKDEPQ